MKLLRHDNFHPQNTGVQRGKGDGEGIQSIGVLMAGTPSSFPVSSAHQPVRFFFFLFHKPPPLSL